MNPVYLHKDEMDWELNIRGICTKDISNRDMKISILRGHLTCEKESKVTLPDVEMNFQDEMEICKKKLLLLSDLVNKFYSDKRHPDYKRYKTRILHLSNRINYLKPLNSPSANGKAQLISQCMLLIDKLEQKASSVAETDHNISLIELEDEVINLNTIVSQTDAMIPNSVDNLYSSANQERVKIISDVLLNQSCSSNNQNLSKDPNKDTFNDEISNINSSLFRMTETYRQVSEDIDKNHNFSVPVSIYPSLTNINAAHNVGQNSNPSVIGNMPVGLENVPKSLAHGHTNLDYSNPTMHEAVTDCFNTSTNKLLPSNCNNPGPAVKFQDADQAHFSNTFTLPNHMQNYRSLPNLNGNSLPSINNYTFPSNLARPNMPQFQSFPPNLGESNMPQQTGASIPHFQDAKVPYNFGTGINNSFLPFGHSFSQNPRINMSDPHNYVPPYNPPFQYNVPNFVDSQRIPPFYKSNLKFNGKGQSLHSFLEKVEEFCLSHRISRNNLLNFAHEFFEGDALIWFRSLRKYLTSWDDLVYHLRLDFLPIDFEVALWDEVRARTQGINERPLLYIAVMENLFKRFVNPVDELTQLRLIMRNLLPYYQQQLVFRQPLSILELKHLCRVLEDTKIRSEMFQGPPSCSQSTLEPELAYKKTVSTNKISNFTKFNPRFNSTNEINVSSDLSIQSQPSGHLSIPENNQSNVEAINLNSTKCWNCNALGHVYQNCKSKKAIFCFGCGEKNITKPKCLKCKAKNEVRATSESVEVANKE